MSARKHKNIAKTDQDRIDRLVTSEADDAAAWEPAVRIERSEPASLSEPMLLREVEEKEGEGGYGDLIRSMRASGMPHPQIWHLFAYKP